LSLQIIKIFSFLVAQKCYNIYKLIIKGYIMALNATVRARVDEQLKYEVEEILRVIGLSTSQAITLFLKRIRYEKGIPFELKVPNAITIKAMEEADRNDGETVSFDEFLKESSSHAKTL
jgi:DNA-damage-inducible protein J